METRSCGSTPSGLAKTYTTFEGLADFRPIGQSGKKIFRRSSRNDTKITHRRTGRFGVPGTGMQGREKGEKRAGRGSVRLFLLACQGGAATMSWRAASGAPPGLGPMHQARRPPSGPAPVDGRRLEVSSGETAGTSWLLSRCESFLAPPRDGGTRSMVLNWMWILLGVAWAAVMTATSSRRARRAAVVQSPSPRTSTPMGYRRFGGSPVDQYVSPGRLHRRRTGVWPDRPWGA